MNIINQSVKLIEKPEFADRMSVLKYIEKIGRVCYKSEDKITDESCVKFVKMLRDRKHWAMLEHFIFTFDVPEAAFELYRYALSTINDANLQKFSRYINTSKYLDPDSGMHFLISASATALNNMLHIPGVSIAVINALAKRLWEEIPELILPNEDPARRADFDNADTSGFVIMQPHNVSKLPLNIRIQHDWFTAFFITNRGVTHEIVRHRPYSFAQESTRYVKYGDMTVIKPLINSSTTADEVELQKYATWIHAMETAEQSYAKLIDLGAKPQEARGVLPNDVKTEINMTGRLESWPHFFNMRCDKAAHPQMREVALSLYDQVHAAMPEIFPEKEW